MKTLRAQIKDELLREPQQHLPGFQFVLKTEMRHNANLIFVEVFNLFIKSKSDFKDNTEFSRTKFSLYFSSDNFICKFTS